MTTQQIAATRAHTVDALGGLFARYGLVIVIAWYGGLKFMNYESEGIQPLVSAAGGFLIKDIALLGISVWTLTDALRVLRSG